MTPPTVYVESNFLIELVFQQEEAAACADILLMAEAGSCELVLPLFALVEPAETVRRRRDEMLQFAITLTNNLRQLERMGAVGLDPGAHTLQSTQFRDAVNDWVPRFEQTRERVMRIARRLIPLESTTIERAQQLVRDDILPREPDAIMLASVLADLGKGRPESLFLNRNTKDFSEVASILNPLGCSVIGSFAKGLARLKAQLKPAEPESKAEES